MRANGHTDNIMHGKTIFGLAHQSERLVDLKISPCSGEESSYDLSTSWREEENFMNTPGAQEKLIYFLIQQSKTCDIVDVAFDLATNQRGGLCLGSKYTAACWKPKHHGRSEEKVRLLFEFSQSTASFSGTSNQTVVVWPHTVKFCSLFLCTESDHIRRVYGSLYNHFYKNKW